MATKDIADLQVIEAYIQFRISSSVYGVHDRWPYVWLQSWTGQCGKVCYRAMERAQRRGLVECGVSLRSGWVTEKGLELVGKYVDEDEGEDLWNLQNLAV